MIQSEALLKLINAFKRNDQKAVDVIIQQMIGDAENRKQHNYAKKLREVYSKPSQEMPTASLHPSSVRNVASDNRLYEVRRSRIDSKKIILSDSNKNTLNEILENYKNRELLEKHGLANDSRIIVHGPPGTGKTLFAYVLAGELDLPLYHVNLDSLVSSYLGETGKNLKLIFEEASKQECILFLDEFDAIAKHRDDAQELGELKRVVTVLLQNIDELNSKTILMAATNHAHLLDPAVWRRFAYSMEMDVPDLISRKSLFKLYLPDQVQIDFDLLADLSEGLSNAVIRQTINRSLRKELLSGDRNFQKILIEGLLVANISQRERAKGEKRKNLVKAIKYLREADPKKYTYEELERITGIPSSTVHHSISTTEE